MMFFRLVLASAVLIPVLAWHVGASRAVADVRDTGWRAFAVGFLNAALPFVLIAWGSTSTRGGDRQRHRADLRRPPRAQVQPERAGPGVRLAGILVGLAGVGVLAGLHPEGSWLAVAERLRIVIASALSYAGANHFVQHNFRSTAPLVIATVSCGTAALILLPFALVQWPDELPSWEAIGSIAALGIFGTAVALLFFYRLLNPLRRLRAHRSSPTSPSAHWSTEFSSSARLWP